MCYCGAPNIIFCFCFWVQGQHRVWTVRTQFEVSVGSCLGVPALKRHRCVRAPTRQRERPVAHAETGPPTHAPTAVAPRRPPTCSSNETPLWNLKVPVDSSNTSTYKARPDGETQLTNATFLICPRSNSKSVSEGSAFISYSIENVFRQLLRLTERT